MGVREKRSVEAQKLYKAARTQESVCREYGIDIKKVLKLAGNENRFGCSPRVIEELEKRKGEFSYYPDFNVSTLRKSLSDKLGAPEESFIFGNGSFELISLIGAAFIDEGDEAIYADPSFGWYINVTTLNGGKVIKVPVAYPSSQLCSICSYKNSITRDLAIRKWTCPKCGSIHDRDINAAKNILSKGIEILTKDGTHPDSLFMLGSLESSSKKPPLP